MKTERKGVINIGISSIVVILIGLCFSVLAALAISSARNDYSQSKDLANHTKEYYDAYNEAVERVAKNSNEKEFDVAMNEHQSLHVVYDKNTKTFTEMSVQTTDTWENDFTFTLFGEE
ncbi:MAG: hypothetical protein MJ110_02860 [Lachnospiraceae bacterium]|nr:hypothetical protein [Lachnospiraceae bacterium]